MLDPAGIDLSRATSTERKSEMAKVSETYAGAFVTGAELQPLGQRRQAVIHQAVQEIVGQENAQPKIVLDLVSRQGQPWPRRVVLNKTNALALANAFGDDTDAWPGKPIEIWAETVMFRGKATPGIRLAAVGATTSALPPPPPASNDNGWTGNGSGADEEIPF
jgi:hypothetical protein